VDQSSKLSLVIFFNEPIEKLDPAGLLDIQDLPGFRGFADNTEPLKR
jgi:hypothetical protein